MIQRLIRDGAVTLNGQRVKPSQEIYVGARVRMDLPAVKEATVEPEDLPIEVMYDDNDLLVVNYLDRTSCQIRV